MKVNLNDLTIIIPAYNEEEGLGQTLEDLSKVSAIKDAQVILIDDGSTDKTAKVAEGFEFVQVISHRYNIGYGGAIKTGVRATKRKYVCWYDADGQHRPEDLIKLVRRVKKVDADWGLGVRSADSHMSMNRKPGRFLLRMAVQLAARRPIPDFNSGLRIFRTECLRRYLHLLPDGFSASTTTSLLMTERGYIGANVKIRTNKRVGKSQVRQVADGLVTLTLILRIMLLFRALLFFFAIGATLVLTGIGYSAYVMSINKQGIPIGGLFLMMTGVLTILMGLIADQLSLIRRERFEEISISTNTNEDEREG